jgi:hypothetical protein
MNFTVTPRRTLFWLALGATALAWLCGASAVLWVVAFASPHSDQEAGVMFVGELCALAMALTGVALSVAAIISESRQKALSPLTIAVLILALIGSMAAPIVWVGWAVFSEPFLMG